MASHAFTNILEIIPARELRALGCPHSGVGEDFWAHWQGLFYENDCNSEAKSRKINPKGTKVWGPIAKNEFIGQNPRLWAQKTPTF